MQQPSKRCPCGTVYALLPGYSRPVYARLGDAFEISVYINWGAVFVTIPPDMNATGAVEQALRQAEAAEQDFRRCNRGEEQPWCMN